MAYPTDIDEFRTVENVPGLDYNAEDAKTMFAEDYAAHSDAITAIENFIGTSAAIKTSPLYLAIANLVYPVGKIVHFTAGIDLNEAMGFGTWEYFGAGRVLVAADASDPDFDTYGETGGLKDVTLTSGELPETVVRTPSKAWRSTSGTYDVGAMASGLYNVLISNTSSHASELTVAGSDEAHENMPPYIVVGRWVRTA